MRRGITILSIMFLHIVTICTDILATDSSIIEFNTDKWVLGDNANNIEYADRKAFNGTAYLKDVEFLNGTIEVDFLTTGKRNFGGIMFRVQSFDEYEWCWIRMHKANGFVQDAIQYAPIFNGNSCWQLNGGRGGISPVNVPKNEWVHMKIEVLNDTARLYVKDMVNPVMVMNDLQLGVKKGSIGIRTYWNEGLYFSNFSYKKDDSKTEPLKENNLSPNILAGWQLSPAYKINDFSEIETYPINKLTGSEDWIEPDVESSGLVNITKYYGHKEGTPPTCVILRTYIDSAEEKSVKMNFGYSDATAIYLNQKPVFSGNSAYRSRNMAYGGWISYEDAVYLNLKEGRNELLVVIAEEFGGCGFQAKLNDIKGIEIGWRSQEVNYGLKDEACRYVKTEDANIYYEVYGEGRPVVLLHGGFAYTDQFKDYIPILSRKYKVIAVAHRGYGKSEIGTKEFSYRLLAEDLKAILQNESREKAIFIGFSSGAWLSYFMAVEYPESVYKVVAMGGDLEKAGKEKEADKEQDKEARIKSLSETFEYFRPDFKKIMPQPERWDEFIENISLLWSESSIARLEDLQKIKCPVLLLFGDRDPSCRPEHIAEIYKHIPNAQLAIIPNSGHLDVSPRNIAILEQYILKFIE